MKRPLSDSHLTWALTGYIFDCMKTISVTDFKARLSEQLRLVESGEILSITDHNRSVAIVQAVAEPLIEYSANRPFQAEPVILSKKYSNVAKALLNAERGER